VGADGFPDLSAAVCSSVIAPSGHHALKTMRPPGASHSGHLGGGDLGSGAKITANTDTRVGRPASSTGMAAA